MELWKMLRSFNHKPERRALPTDSEAHASGLRLNEQDGC